MDTTNQETAQAQKQKHERLEQELRVWETRETDEETREVMMNSIKDSMYIAWRKVEVYEYLESQAEIRPLGNGRYAALLDGEQVATFKTARGMAWAAKELVDGIGGMARVLAPFWLAGQMNEKHGWRA